MPLTELIQSQLTDPFRLGLLVFLYLTMLRTRAQMGEVIPLLAGAVFVAALIPMTTSRVGSEGLVAAIGAGFVVNIAVLGLIRLVHGVIARQKGG